MTPTRVDRCVTPASLPSWNVAATGAGLTSMTIVTFLTPGRLGRVDVDVDGNERCILRALRRLDADKAGVEQDRPVAEHVAFQRRPDLVRACHGLLGSGWPAPTSAPPATAAKKSVATERRSLRKILDRIGASTGSKVVPWRIKDTTSHARWQTTRLGRSGGYSHSSSA